jgi:hypothetical protein
MVVEEEENGINSTTTKIALDYTTCTSKFYSYAPWRIVTNVLCFE